MTVEQALVELEQRHRALYATPEIDERLASIVRAGPHTNLTEAAILHILRSARSVFVDTHVEVVSGHHTATYLRFESIARYPDLIGLIADDMATWIKQTFQHGAVTGLLATASAARALAQGVADRLQEAQPLRVTLTPFSCETGRIGTDITDNGGRLVGMMVFARRDSGQFPLMKDLVAQYPFYYAADLEMPQWEPAQCPLCQSNKPLMSWKDMPE